VHTIDNKIDMICLSFVREPIALMMGWAWFLI